MPKGKLFNMSVLINMLSACLRILHILFPDGGPSQEEKDTQCENIFPDIPNEGEDFNMDLSYF